MLDERQEYIVYNANMKSIVIAAAGSGKTEVLIERAKFLLDSGVDPREMAIITFTNLAAEEIVGRISCEVLPFIGTIHSFANQVLLRNGIKTAQFIEEEKYDELLKNAILNKQAFSNYNYILWDEVQDSSNLEFDFILKAINPYSYFLVGDPRQCIYQFKGSNPNLIVNLSQSSETTTYYMNNNYRCGYNILKYAKNIIAKTGFNDESICASKRNGSVTEIPYSESYIIKKLKELESFDSCAILTRTNQEILTISNFLKKSQIPFVTFKQSELNKSKLEEALNKNAVKLLTVHSAKGMAFDNVIAIGMRYAPYEERNVCYVAATRARNNLIWMHYVAKKKNTVKMYKW